MGHGSGTSHRITLDQCGQRRDQSPKTSTYSDLPQRPDSLSSHIFTRHAHLCRSPQDIPPVRHQTTRPHAVATTPVPFTSSDDTVDSVVDSPVPKSILGHGRHGASFGKSHVASKGWVGQSQRQILPVNILEDKGVSILRMERLGAIPPAIGLSLP